MPEIGLWHVADNAVPKRLAAKPFELERQLEEWIANDPALVQPGLMIVGRQIRTEGGPLDLLALDTEGRFVVIEIKRARVGRETIAQAMDYAGCISEMPADRLRGIVQDWVAKQPPSRQKAIEARLEDAQFGTAGERPVVTILVGTGQDASLQRMGRHAKRQFGFDLRVISFNFYDTANGQRVLVRELTDADDDAPAEPAGTRGKGSRADLAVTLAEADKYGTRADLQKFVDAGKELDLWMRAWPKSVMFSPPMKKKRAMLTVWCKPQRDKTLKLWVGDEYFAEYYGINEKELRRRLGGVGWTSVMRSDVDKLLRELKEMLAPDEGAQP